MPFEAGFDVDAEDDVTEVAEETTNSFVYSADVRGVVAVE